MTIYFTLLKRLCYLLLIIVNFTVLFLQQKLCPHLLKLLGDEMLQELLSLRELSEAKMEDDFNP